MYSEAEAHLNNLDCLGAREVRRAYLAIVLAAERAGLRALPRTLGGRRELLIRDAMDSQPYAVLVHPGSLDFLLRRPALERRPHLRVQAEDRFPGRVSGSNDEVRIRIDSEGDGEDLGDWLFPALTPGYAERISA